MIICVCIFYRFRPDLIQYEKLQKSNAMYNLNNAFKVAEEKLGVTPLLDAEGKPCIRTRSLYIINSLSTE